LSENSDRPLIGIKLHSGLGNQMFMYAAGLAMAERLGGTLICDTRRFRSRNTRADRQLAIESFGIRLKRGPVPPHNDLYLLASALGLWRDPFRGAPRLKTYMAYVPRFHEIDGTCALRGYFQSWRYLAGHERAVRAAFDIDQLATERTAAIAAEIAASDNPVAVHVRRGDYVNKSSEPSGFAILRRDYYDAARRAIEARADVHPTYFLFSDEPQAAMAELDGWPKLHPVTGFGHLEDLRLMALCRHFITANSTFSWWAAWLGRSPEKHVVAPNLWFGPGLAHLESREDRIMPDWTVA